VAGDREAVDASEAVQRDDRDHLAGDEQDEGAARLGTLLHAGTVKHAIWRVNASDDVRLNEPVSAAC
jgi:hypothetical protein